MIKSRISLPSSPKCLRFDMPRVADGTFAVKASGDRGTISMFGVVGYEITPASVAAAMREIGDKPINIEINSPGGSYFDGVAIFNLLRAHPKPVQAHVLGTAASAASVIIMAASVIEIARNAEIMLHNPWGIVAGNADDMVAAEKWLRQLNATCAAVYADRTGHSVADVAAMMDEETHLNSDMAIALGFADKLLERDALPAPAASQSAVPQSKRELETQLRDIGFSKVAASRVAAGGWSALAKEADEEPDFSRVADCLASQSIDINQHLKGSFK